MLSNLLPKDLQSKMWLVVAVDAVVVFRPAPLRAGPGGGAQRCYWEVRGGRRPLRSGQSDLEGTAVDMGAGTWRGAGRVLK